MNRKLVSALLPIVDVVARLANPSGGERDSGHSINEEKRMPQVVVKMLPGRTEQQKAQLAGAIVKDVVAIAEWSEESVSVAIEEVKAGIGTRRSTGRKSCRAWRSSTRSRDTNDFE